MMLIGVSYFFCYDHMPWYEDGYALAATIGLDMDTNFSWLLL